MRSTRDNDIYQWSAVRQADGSYIDRFGYINWYNKSGQRHKEDGPAFWVPRYPRLSWCLNDKEYDSFDEWLKASPIQDEQKMLLRLQYE
jgi:hypothetical protein